MHEFIKTWNETKSKQIKFRTISSGLSFELHPISSDDNSK